MECTDRIYFRVNGKKMRLCVELCDSEDEYDEWLSVSILDKYGLHPRTQWMHPLNKQREVNGEYVRICLPLREHPDRFFKYFRMAISTYDYVLEKIREDITKHSYRPSISAGERLAVTLRYLSTGLSFEALSHSFLMDDYTIELIVREVCEKIYENMRSKHMPIPSPARFKEIADEYEILWQFPNCVGAIDGKHIRIKPPPHSGSMNFNYKLYNSIVLQAVADARYKFIFVDVGAYGKQSDGGIFAASSLSKFIEDRDNFPPDRVIQGLDIRLPYLFVCDDAYPLKTNMMKPYSGSNLTPQKDIFNGRLSRARRCVECAFGVLANKWRLLMKQIETKKPNAAETIVKCLTVLHNVIIDEEGIDETLLKSVQEKTNSREAAASLHTGRRFNHSAVAATTIRDCWMKYFNSPAGSVSWQDRYIKN